MTISPPWLLADEEMPAKTTAPFWSVSLNAGRVRTKHNKPNAQFKRNPTVVHFLKEEKKQHTLTTRISHDGPTGNATGKQLTHETSGNPFLYYILSLFLSLWVRTLFYLGESPPGKTHTHGTGGVGWADRELSTASRVLNLYI